MESKMLVYEGKTKDLRQDEKGNYYFYFKDDVTGKDGVFDPGANQVGASMEGAGRSNLIVSSYFFELLEKKGIPSHYISSNLEDNTMAIKKAKLFGQGLELICRFKAVGSFIRRYGMYAETGQALDAYVEVTLKDDEREDPLITQDALEQLRILKQGEYEQLTKLTREISILIKEALEEKGLELYDIKLEFGRLDGSDQIILIDEVSGGNMRVYKGDQYIEPLSLVDYFQ